MNRWLVICIGLYACWSTSVNAQFITPQSSGKDIKLFLKNKGADKVEFCPTHKDVYFVRDKKTKKWGMFDWYGQLVPMEYDTIQRFEQFQPYTIAKKDGSFVIIQWPYDTESDGVRKLEGYDELRIERPGNSEVSSSNYFLVARKKGKWGCLDWRTLKEIMQVCFSSGNTHKLS